MSAYEDRAEAAKLPEGDLVAVLLVQHARMKDLMEQITEAAGHERSLLFEHLATTITAHETAEESVVRPVTKETAGAAVADARIAEESAADELIATLLDLDVDSADFDRQFAAFKQAVTQHAEAEETEEFPTILSGRSDDERRVLGVQFLVAFGAAGGSASGAFADREVPAI
ncbi:MAG: hypothetical protein QOJ62_2578 [Actinomycetota bacterium]|jgi:hemerythrin superfamily protein|nr:hypothetical protein [Actinomycetota bacterium]